MDRIGIIIGLIGIGLGIIMAGAAVYFPLAAALGWWPWANGEESTLVADFHESMFNPEGPEDQPSSEYVCIRNESGNDINMLLWTVEDGERHTFKFPKLILPSDRQVRVTTGRGQRSADDLYWKRDSEVWDDDLDVVTMRKPDGSVVFKDDYSERPEGDAGGPCGPPKNQSVGIVLADFQSQFPSDVLTSTAIRSVREDPEACSLFDCLEIDYSATGPGEEPVGFSLDFLGASNFAPRKSVCVEARGEEGGETFAISIEDIKGNTESVPVDALSTEWDLFELPLSQFSGVDLQQVSSVDVLFGQPQPTGTAFFQTIFVTVEGTCEDTGVLVAGDPLLPQP